MIQREGRVLVEEIDEDDLGLALQGLGQATRGGHVTAARLGHDDGNFG